MSESNELEQEKLALLRVIVALQLEERTQRADGDVLPPELLLSGLGLDYKQIAPLVGKKPDAVRMFLNRRS